MIRFLGLIVGFLWLSPVEAATCRDPAGFEAWLADFKSEAAASGISPSAIGALDGVAFDPGIVAKDHGHRVFGQSFEQFSGCMVPPRLHGGQALMKQYAATLVRIEQAYGVPAPVIVAIWGLETDFGAGSGDTPTLRALATLAYYCRRSDMSQAELMDASRLV
jgi:membrane-bound lytic murein transglycosylase B